MTLENGPDSPYQTWSTWRKTELRIVGSSMLSPTPDNGYGKLHFSVRLPRMVLKLLYLSLITMRSRLFPANSASVCLRFAKFRPQFSESCGATYKHICEIFSAFAKCIWSCNRFWKQGPNRCIIGDAIVPQTGTKLTKNAVLNLALCCGAIWRHREKPQYAQRVHNDNAYNWS